MGDPSKLRFVPASSSATPIDWSRVPEETKTYLIKQYGYDWEKMEYKPLPATIGDLAKMFDESKFFGYFKSKLVKVLMDISEFGLQPTLPAPGRSRPVGPRFYMTYLDEVWFLLFAPGTREGIVGNSDRIIRKTELDDDYDEDEDDDAAYEKKEAATAQTFDVKLEHEVSRGKGEMVEITEKLCGWTASTLPSSLEESQFTEAIMSLPPSHPAYRGFMKNFFDSLSSR